MPDSVLAHRPPVRVKARIAVLGIGQLIVDLALPSIVYLLLGPLGLSTVLQLTLSGVPLAVLTLAELARRRQLDGFAGLVIIEIAATAALTAASHDARFVAIRPSFYTAIAGLYALATVRAHEPFMTRVSRPMAIAGDPQRATAFERALRQSRPFRRAGQAMTAGLGIVLLTEAALRVLLVLSFPAHRVAHALAIANLPGIALLIAYFALIRIFAVPVARREVDALMPTAQPNPNTPAHDLRRPRQAQAISPAALAPITPSRSSPAIRRSPTMSGAEQGLILAAVLLLAFAISQYFQRRRRR